MALLTGCGGGSGSPERVASPCTTAALAGRPLTDVRTAIVLVPGTPFGVANAASGPWSFVSAGDQVAVMSTAGFAPTLVRSVTLPQLTSRSLTASAVQSVTGPRPAVGETVTHDGRDLLGPAGTAQSC